MEHFNSPVSGADGKRLKLFVLIFIGIGVLLIALSFFIKSCSVKEEDRVYTVGVIDNITTSYSTFDEDTSHTVYVRYSVDGTERVSTLGYYSSSFRIGQRLNIYYDRSDPGKIGTEGGDRTGRIIMIAVGCGFILIPAAGIIATKKNASKAD